MKRLAILLATLVACGAPSQDEPCRERRCNTVALAFEATDPLVEEVVADLREATGADVITDPFGIPVVFAPEVLDPKTGKPLCGLTFHDRIGDAVVWQEIHVATELPDGCVSLWTTLAHEMIHALAPKAKHVDEGVFANPTDAERFSPADVDVVCSAVACDR